MKRFEKLPERRILHPSELKNLVGMTVWIGDYWLKDHWAVVVGCDEYSVVFRTEHEAVRLMNCVWRIEWTAWNRPPDHYAKHEIAEIGKEDT